MRVYFGEKRTIRIDFKPWKNEAVNGRPRCFGPAQFPMTMTPICFRYVSGCDD